MPRHTSSATTATSSVTSTSCFPGGTPAPPGRPDGHARWSVAETVTPDGHDGAMTSAPEPVGLVLGSDDATPLSFWVALAPGQVLQLDDVVVTVRTLPDGGRVVISGV